ncbi:(2Fe-2S)-binding protein [Candidatus Desantisbacteria bacterium]|nr:(2Fe-2S)-binding protein [Candidatus Desantisbacteria bacterium]
MIKFIINDRELEVENGKTILEAAFASGIKIPTLCYNKELSPYGACRLCLVEIAGGGRIGLHAACLYKVTEGLIVKTDTERVKKARKIVIELLLAGNPDSEKIKLIAEEYGVNKTRINLGTRTDCILCGLCVRVCAEVVGMSAISFAGRGTRKKVQTPFDKISDTCIGCGACAYICPTKAIKIEQV